MLGRLLLPTLALSFALSVVAKGNDLQVVKYNHPGLVVDLGVGLWAWPMPMDYDGDGDLDLVVSCPDKPYNGTYFFENRQPKAKLPVFEPGVRIGKGYHNARVSYVDGKPRVLLPGQELTDFRAQRFEAPRKFDLPKNVHTKGRKIRANGWHLVDYDADGDEDVIVGVGDWADYGWDDAWNDDGEWTNGPLHGFVYLVRNDGGKYAEPVKVEAGGKPVDVFGWPNPNFADFDGDGDLDLVCGNFLDHFTYFENEGTRAAPRYAAGALLRGVDGQPLRMDLQMIVPTAIDWDGDGDMDLVVGDEDGRVAFVEHTGVVKDGWPRFKPPVYFQQKADELKFGALATPVGFDWDGDGDDDLLCGNTAGNIGFFENLGGEPIKWAAPKLLAADGRTIRIQAGPNGSIQGPAEAKWGYTTLTAADWDGNGLPDLIVNSIWGKVVWFPNVGTRTEPKLAAMRPIAVASPGETPKPSWTWWTPEKGTLVTQWRTTPVAVDWNRDGAMDLVMLDHEGYLAFFERTTNEGRLHVLSAGRRIFVDEENRPWRLNDGHAGRSGRRKLCIVDWDGDGRLDVLANSANSDLYRNLGERDGKVVLKYEGQIGERNVAGHTSSPTVVNWNRDNIPDLLVGAEDGRLYHLVNPRSK